MHRYTRKSAFATLAVAIACVGSAGKPHARQGAGHVRPGITVLLADSSALIDGKRIGLLTNQTGVDEKGVSDIDLIVKRGTAKGAAGPQLTALFSPEHGIRGTEDHTNLANGKDLRTGIPIYSLYGATTLAPPDSVLKNLDVLDHRHAGPRRAPMDLRRDDGLRDALRRGAAPARARARPPESDHGRARGRADTRFALRLRGKPQRGARGHADGALSDSHATWADDGRARALLQRCARDSRGSACDPGNRMASRRLVRPDEAAVDQAVAEHAEPHERDALSRRGVARGDEHLGGARHGRARSSTSARRGSTPGRRSICSRRIALPA